MKQITHHQGRTNSGWCNTYVCVYMCSHSSTVADRVWAELGLSPFFVRKLNVGGVTCQPFLSFEMGAKIIIFKGSVCFVSV